MTKTLRHAVDERWLLAPPQPGEKYHWPDIFGNDSATEVEIGAGKGRFLLAECQARPGVNFLGIERARKYLRIGLDRLNRSGASNARVLCADAIQVLEQCLPENSVQAFHVYFPDPWPKARHHKRRLFRPPVAQLLRRALADGGEINAASDHGEYFEHILHVLDGSGDWANVEVWDTACGAEDTPTATHFEIKFRREKRRVHRARYRLPL